MLAEQVGQHFHTLLAETPDEFLALMLSWGLKMRGKFTDERIADLWTNPRVAFPWFRLNPKQAVLEAPTFTVSDGTTMIQPPYSKKGLNSVIWSNYDSGEAYNIKDRLGAVIALPMESRGGTMATIYFVYAWSDQKQQWLPSVLFRVTAEGAPSVDSPIVF